MRRILVLLPLLLGACSSPADFWHFNSQHLVIMEAQGPPRDSTAFYFPAADSLHAAYIPRPNRPKEGASYIATTSCQSHLEYASYTLFRFRAPVLSSVYPGADTYRFLWLRSFDRPVLLTLQRQQGGTVLRTQFLSKPIPAYRPLSAYYLNEVLSPAEQEALRKREQEQMANPELRAALIRAKEPVVLVAEEETTKRVTQDQWQHFLSLLEASHFQQLSACQPRGLLDGAHWMLEARTISNYHMVDRHSPKKTDGFRQACEYLLDLSSAQQERRY